MNTPETLATLDTHDTGRIQTKHKNKTKMSNMYPTKNSGVNPGARGVLIY